MITISIVTYNSATIIQNTVDSLLACISGDVQIFMIDNASTDSTPEILKDYASRHKNTHFIPNPENSGYGRAHNIAIERAESDFHLICNPDITLTPEVLKILVDYMNNNQDIGIVCPRVLNEDGSLQTLNKQYPTVLDLLLRRVAPSFLKKIFQKRMSRYEMRHMGYDNVYEVPFLTGAFMFCRTSILKSVGGFDRRYFMYFEDADLCRKFQDAGYKTIYYPYCTVTHKWARASHKNLRMMIIHIVNGIRYFNKWGWMYW